MASNRNGIDLFKFSFKSKTVILNDSNMIFRKKKFKLTSSLEFCGAKSWNWQRYARGKNWLAICGRLK